MTAPPTGCDPNDVLKRGGPDALKKLLTEARCDLGKFDDAAFLDEVCRLDDLAYDRARETALKLLGLSKLDTLDKQRDRDPQALGRDAGKHRNPAGPRRRPALARTGHGHRAGARHRARGTRALRHRPAAPAGDGGALERLCAPAAARGSRHRRRAASRHSEQGSGLRQINPARMRRQPHAQPGPRRFDHALVDLPHHRRERARPCSSTRPTTSSTRTAAPTCSPSSTAATGGGRPTSSGLSRRMTEAGCPSSSTPSRALLSRGSKFSPRPCRTAVSGCRSTRRPGKRSRSIWSTATAPSSSSAGASSPAGPPTCRSCRP